VVLAVALAAFALSAVELYEQGTALFQSGKLAEAAQRFEEASRLAPKNARIWKALGVSYAATADYERANGPLHQACNLDPSLDDACYYYGRNLYAMNRFEPALAALNRSLRATRYPWRVHLALGQAYEGLANPRQAEPAFRKAISLFEGLSANMRGRPEFDPRVHYALFLYRQARLDEALKVAQQASNDWPDYGKAHFELGRILYQQGKLEAAAGSLEKAVRYGAGAPAHLLLGQIYRRLGRTKEAESHITAGAASSEQAP
jgi:Flp pilus assembly protein TadD